MLSEEAEKEAEERQSPESKNRLRQQVKDPIQINDANTAAAVTAIGVLVFLLLILYCLYWQKKIVPMGKMA